jgi:hypothetical protein
MTCVRSLQSSPASLQCAGSMIDRRESPLALLRQRIEDDGTWLIFRALHGARATGLQDLGRPEREDMVGHDPKRFPPRGRLEDPFLEPFHEGREAPAEGTSAAFRKGRTFRQ